MYGYRFSGPVFKFDAILTLSSKCDICSVASKDNFFNLFVKIEEKYKTRKVALKMNKEKPNLLLNH